MTAKPQYRWNALKDKMIAFSVSYEPENLLARGLGVEHLNELLIRLARPLLRQSANLAYGGNWVEEEGNFTYALLRLISAEQEDNSIGGPDTSFQIGKLFNHSAWPHYLRITPKIEAEWINCCRIVRITQQLAGIGEDDIVPDADVKTDARTPLNQALTVSAMRRKMMEKMTLPATDVEPDEEVPAVVARILLGGRTVGYTGFLPGIFEEALVTLEHDCPTYLLGGFGGAAEVLAGAMLETGTGRPDQLTLAWHVKRTPALGDLLAAARQRGLTGIERSFDRLFEFVLRARLDLPGTLHTGLDEADTRELLGTANIARAVHLVREGLGKMKSLPDLKA